VTTATRKAAYYIVRSDYRNSIADYERMELTPEQAASIKTLLSSDIMGHLKYEVAWDIETPDDFLEHVKTSSEVHEDVIDNLREEGLLPREENDEAESTE
jgi:hypothetical protein